MPGIIAMTVIAVKTSPIMPPDLGFALRIDNAAKDTKRETIVAITNINIGLYHA